MTAQRLNRRTPGPRRHVADHHTQTRPGRLNSDTEKADDHFAEGYRTHAETHAHHQWSDDVRQNVPHQYRRRANAHRTRSVNVRRSANRQCLPADQSH